jgi:glycosyltransferase involved in cell wall biosynthesis
MSFKNSLSYVLITPAKNEERNIEKNIVSVISQTIRPTKWVIVSDGSTDRTDEIVNKYVAQHSWMEIVRMPVRTERDFAAKVHCFNAGYQKINDLNYDIIGNLDADITFDSDYFEFLLGQFERNPRLGVAGTPFVENTSVIYNYNFANIEHVSGACQLFRRQCFEDIGGYIPIKGGGIDWTAVTSARMKGWKARTFTEKTFFHHRPMGTAENGKLKAWFKHGKKDYYLGGHPVWEILRSIFQMKSKPYVLGGLCLFIGYAWGAISRMDRPIPKELMHFHRVEQMQRLKNILLGRNRTVEQIDGRM